jgi:hypothetical protein
MAESLTLHPDVRPILSLIRRTARLLRSSWLATGTGLTMGLGLGTLVALALVDLAIPLVPVLRLIALGLVVVPTAWAFISGVIRPLLRRLRPVQVARRIENHLPAIHNRLVSCVDLENGGIRARVSPEFHRRLVTETLERIRGFRPGKVIDGRSLRRAVLLAGTSVAAFALALGLFSDRIPTALARIFSPLADIPPASGVIYTVEPGDAQVLRGEDVEFLAHVQQGEPDRLQLEILPDGQARALFYDLEHVERGLWRFRLAGFESSFDYRVRGGGTWTTKKRITVVDRPSIAGLGTVLHYPDYLGIPEAKIGPPQVTDVAGPVGSTVEVIVDTLGDVARGEIQLLGSRPARVPVLDRPERIWFQEFVPEGAGQEGSWYWDFRLLARPAHTEPPAPGVHGHRFANIRTPFQLRSSEFLFALVFIDPKEIPEAIMLSWHDGQDWEHRAYWGADRFTEGKADSASRIRIGPLPPAGRWVRLEVPAASVNLEGKALRGMGFTLSGGRCYWHRAGALPPSHVMRDELYVVRTEPLETAGTDRWRGRFALEHDLFYHIELRNTLGYPSKPMKEAKATAIPDGPPQVVLQRPGGDLVLSTPVKVPLSISAYDDFGLADVVISIQRGDSGGFVGRPVHHFTRVERSTSLQTALDMPAYKLKEGEHLRYRVEARDRKGQSAQTQDFFVRIANDGNAADRQLENYDRSQEGLRQSLQRLVEEHLKVQSAIQKLSGEHSESAGKTSASELEAVRREVGQLAAAEEQNARLAEQVADALRQAAEQAGELKMLPSEMLRQLGGLQQEFRSGAVQPLREVAEDLKRGADARQPAPDLKALRSDTDRIQRRLEETRDRLQAAERARRDLPRDPDAAVAALRENELRAAAGLTERELQELQQAVRAQGRELQELEGQQTELAKATPSAPELLLPDLERRQGAIEPREDRALEDARALLEPAGLRPIEPGEPEIDAAAKQGRPDGQTEKDQRDTRRAALQSRQQGRIDQLQQTRSALSREDQSLERVVGQLEKSLRERTAGSSDERLAELVRSAEVRRALAMAQRGRQRVQTRQNPGRRDASITDRPDQLPTTDKMVAPLEAELPDLDLATRSMILKLRPQVREELLQGLREEGPEGYKTFIRNYFKRLSQVKGNQ